VISQNRDAARAMRRARPDLSGRFDMNHSLNRIPAASVLAACLALASVPSMANVKVCTFPGSPSAALDQTVARDVFAQAGIAATFVKHGIGDGDDDGVSLKELDRTLARDCDVIAGFPRSIVADASNSKLQFSRGYLRAGYVSIEAPDANPQGAAKNTVAAMYASPAQLIAVQQQSITLDLENTSALTVDAVARGHAQRAIVWYPAVVAYRLAHPQQRFTVAAARSPYADWQLVFAFGPRTAALRERIDASLDTLSNDGGLIALTRDWTMPANAIAETADDPARYRDGPGASHGSRAVVRPALLAAANSNDAGGFVKIAADAASGAPSFDQAQATHGKMLYSAACAKCHDQDYADIMAFLLYSNGYRPGGAKMTADNARASATPLNAGK
jgi:polar amino acid transport system substrate-binding protein